MEPPLARPNARNISTQHLATITLLDRVVKELAKRAQHLATSKYSSNKNLTIFKLDPRSCNILQHVDTGRPNACNTFRATMLQDVRLKCCVRLAGPLALPTWIKSILVWGMQSDQRQRRGLFPCLPGCMFTYKGSDSVYLLVMSVTI